jgi:hypothetical protein
MVHDKLFVVERATNPIDLLTVGLHHDGLSNNVLDSEDLSGR